jgi:hypothetical protein
MCFILPFEAMFTGTSNKSLDTAYTTSFWTNAHRYCILSFGAIFTVTGLLHANLFTDTAYTIHVQHFGPLLTGTTYTILWSNIYRYCEQIFGAISQIPHTLLHFGPLLSGTAYYSILWSNVYRFCIQIFGAISQML